MVKILGFDEPQFWNTWEKLAFPNEKMIIWGTQVKQKKEGFSSNLVYQENNYFSYDWTIFTYMWKMHNFGFQ
jgi:hypothetical protein